MGWKAPPSAVPPAGSLGAGLSDPYQAIASPSHGLANRNLRPADFAASTIYPAMMAARAIATRSRSNTVGAAWNTLRIASSHSNSCAAERQLASASASIRAW